MGIEGIQPNKGAGGEKAGAAKASPTPGGKSFGAALEKAAAALSKNPNPPPAEDPGARTALPRAMPSESAGTAGETATPPADPLEMIRFRMKTGYYNSKTLDDALTEKLTGFFDDLT